MILQSLYSLYNRLAEDEANGLPKPGYSLQEISLRVILGQDGSLIDISDYRDELVSMNKAGRETRSLKPVKLMVPGQARASEASFDPSLLWDDTRFVFGWHGVKNDPERNLKCLQNFRQLHYELEASLNDADFTAVCNFLRNWSPDDATKHDGLIAVKKGRVVFQISGKTKFVHENKSIQDLIGKSTATSNQVAILRQCLITGKTSEPIARLHPGIINMPGSPYTGASLVSFNDSAYESYGKEGKDHGRGANSPSGETAVAGYSAALDWLLSKKERHFRLIDTTTVFWTDRPTPAETSLPWMVSGVPQSEDAATLNRIHDLLEKIARGTIGRNELGDPESNYYILGMSLNQGRLSVRFWHTGTLGELLSNLKLHFENLSLVRQWDETSTHPDPLTPSAYQLLRQTARDADGIPPQLSGALMRSILLRTCYPDTLINGVMNRIRVVEKKPKGEGTLDNVSYLRATILKAWLIRNHPQWLQHHQIHMKPALDKDTPHVAYQLGRLFAVFEQVQRAAHEYKLERTIRETMFSSASANPVSVFGRLDRLNKHHLAKLTVGSNRHYSDLIDEIHQKVLGPKFYPASLNLKEQSLFCIGYYHQRHELRQKSKSNTTNPVAA